MTDGEPASDTAAQGYSGAAGVLASVTAALWAGIGIGTSLIAAPAKFQAPSLSLPAALEIGRVTFRLSGYAEYSCVGVLTIACLIAAPKAGLRWLAVPIGALLLQRHWLLPVLDAHTLAIIHGALLPTTQYHKLYILLELAKIAALGLLAYRMARPRSSQSHGFNAGPCSSQHE